MVGWIISQGWKLSTLILNWCYWKNWGDESSLPTLKGLPTDLLLRSMLTLCLCSSFTLVTPLMALGGYFVADVAGMGAWQMRSLMYLFSWLMHSDCFWLLLLLRRTLRGTAAGAKLSSSTSIILYSISTLKCSLHHQLLPQQGDLPLLQTHPLPVPPRQVAPPLVQQVPLRVNVVQPLPYDHLLRGSHQQLPVLRPSRLILRFHPTRQHTPEVTSTLRLLQLVHPLVQRLDGLCEGNAHLLVDEGNDLIDCFVDLCVDQLHVPVNAAPHPLNLLYRRPHLPVVQTQVLLHLPQTPLQFFDPLFSEGPPSHLSHEPHRLLYLLPHPLVPPFQQLAHGLRL